MRPSSGEGVEGQEKGERDAAVQAVDAPGKRTHDALSDCSDDEGTTIAKVRHSMW